MPTPASGQISLSDIASIIYNSSTNQTSMSNTEVRILINDTVGDISLSSAYNKPTAGNSGITYYTPGPYSFVVPGYKTLTATVAGGGGSGGSYCGGQVYLAPCVNYCCSPPGNAGGNSDFNGVFAYGGDRGLSASGGIGADGGNNLNANTGGGGAKGLGNTNPADTYDCQAAGSNGGAGGYALKSWTKAVTSGNPGYGDTINFTVGIPGPKPSNTSCRDQRGGPGGSGYVYVEWSG